MKIIIDNQPCEVEKNVLTVRDILLRADKPEEHHDMYKLIRVTKEGQKEILYSPVQGPETTPDYKVHLQEEECFEIDIAAVAITVNASEKRWPKQEISYKALIELAFDSYEDNPNIAHTIVYFGGPPENQEGSIVENGKVKIIDGMVFNVTKTDKS